MKLAREPLRFTCGAAHLIGVLHLPERPAARGVVIVNGGPQYRAGSHRQFTLLADALAASGVAALRFDPRGMGDSEGHFQGFEQLDADIEAATKALQRQVPGLRELVLVGLCDGATAATFYAPRDPRVRGLVLLNPWVRTAEGEARATLRHYYARRLSERAFWRKLLSGQVNVASSLGALADNARGASTHSQNGLPLRVAASLRQFRGPVLLIVSGDDLTAREFDAFLKQYPRPCERIDIPAANHTFARREWRDQVASHCAHWIASW